jgi:hypothetical protein
MHHDLVHKYGSPLAAAAFSFPFFQLGFAVARKRISRLASSCIAGVEQASTSQHAAAARGAVKLHTR